MSQKLENLHVPSTFKRLAQGSLARAYNIEEARKACTSQVAIITPDSFVGRRLRLPRIVAVPTVIFGVLFLAGCDSVARTIDFSGKVDVRPQTAGGVVTGTVGGGLAKPGETPTASVAKAAETSRPAATATPEVARVVDGVSLINIPDRVDPNVVDVARGVFKNETGVAPHIFAEPGGLLVGPDFGYTGTKNPWGQNPAGWEAMYAAGGSINPFSPVTQEVLRYPGSAFQNLPEGGFVFASAGQMTFILPHPEKGKVVIKMAARPGHNYFFVARGFYPDGKQDSDRNTTTEITDYRPGHAEVEMYESRIETNTAFVSEGQLLQKAVTSHTTGANCGAEGCSGLTVVAYDHNTGATEIWQHKGERSLDVAKAKVGWTRAFSNWR